MQTTQHPITGNEEVVDPQSPYAALVDFYNGFNQRNLRQVRTNWLQSELACMANPLGGIKRGWQDIEAVYQKIFHGQAKVYVEFYDYSILAGEEMFVAIGRERGWLQLPDQKIPLAIRTSRTFLRDKGQWKQLHHHGSMDDPKLLKNYQQLLLN